MFGLLKNKISSFLSALTKKEDEKSKQQPPEPLQTAQEALPQNQAPAQAPAQAQPNQATNTFQPTISDQPNKTQQLETPVPQTNQNQQKKPDQPQNQARTTILKQPNQATKLDLPTKTGQLEIPAHQINQDPKTKPSKPETTQPILPDPPSSQIPISDAKAQATTKQPGQTSQVRQAQASLPTSQAQKKQYVEQAQLSQQTKKAEMPKDQKAKTSAPKEDSKQIQPPYSFQPSASSALSDKQLERMSKKALKEQAGEHKVQPKLGIVSSITSLFASQITITESDVSDLLDSLELSLLEGDVSYEVSQDIVSSLRSRLIGTKLPKSNLSGSIQSIIREVLVKTMTPQCSFDLMESAKGAKKPYKILFVGPNGAGKTTTMAKLAKAFQAAGLSCVFAAADTFRAAAIEQLEVHAGRLGIHAVKSQYGADPASVAFDAIKYAQGHGIDAVLIDSSGRQDTNANLLAELKKIVRIASPDAKIYIGESLAGNSVVAQVGAFNQAIGLDAVILTKLDCDPKGGCAISITKATGVPVIFVGTGQSYSDLKKFNPDEIASELVAA